MLLSTHDNHMISVLHKGLWVLKIHNYLNSAPRRTDVEMCTLAGSRVLQNREKRKRYWF